MSTLKYFFVRFWPFLTYSIIFIGVFYKTFFLKLLFFPGNLLMARFFPYKSGGWEGYTPWIPYKEFIESDVIRQMYPWRMLAIEQFKNGMVPLWNPFAFSGTPLLANFQSAVFYPINILFFVLQPIAAWNTYILLQPALAFCFMYLFMRSLSISKYGAFFSGLCFGFIGYIVVWFELGIVGHSALWLPLILWAITMRYKKNNWKYFLVATLGISFSLLAGHAQTTLYVLIVSFAYYLSLTYKVFPFTRVFYELWFFALGFGICAMQILPSLELMTLSARNAQNSLEVFKHFKLPFQHLLTIFVPDFFGNPATKNFWGIDYSEFITYFGIVALVFAIIGLWENRQKKIIRFFFFVGIVTLIFSINTPFADLLSLLKVPVLSTSIPARGMFVVMFTMVLFAGFGIDCFVQNKKISKTPLIILISIYVLFIVFLLIGNQIFKNIITAEQLATAQRNTIIPLGIFFSTIISVGISIKYKQITRYLFVLIIILCFFEYQYFLYKFSPLSPAAYVYPKQTLIDFLAKQTPPDRVYGYGGASLGTNLPTQWHVLSSEGYDPLYTGRYGELLYASRNGKYVSKIPRSDADFPDTLPLHDTYAKRVLLNVLGVKYIIAEDSLGRDFSAFRNTFPENEYEYFRKFDTSRIYKNRNVFPRSSVFYSYKTIANNSEIIDKLFSKNFDYTSELIVEESPKEFNAGHIKPTVATITNYQADKVEIKTDTVRDGFLFLADTYYPGWIAYVDAKESKIYRADYSFRAVFVPAGMHTVVFQYKPMSFTAGIAISILSICIFFVLTLERFILLKLRNRI